MEIIEYFASSEQDYWLKEIQKSDWRAGQYLYELLRDRRLKELCGQNTKVLLLTDGKQLVSFCTYAEQDDVREPSLTPWVGFVYTFPAFRGKRHMGQLLDYAAVLAHEEGKETIYISTGEMEDDEGCERRGQPDLQKRSRKKTDLPGDRNVI